MDCTSMLQLIIKQSIIDSPTFTVPGFFIFCLQHTLRFRSFNCKESFGSVEHKSANTPLLSVYRTLAITVIALATTDECCT